MAIKILILAANPKDTARLRLDEEVREIENGLHRATHREQFEIKAQWAVRIQDLRRAMLDFCPNIVHFSGHGEGEPGITFEDDIGKSHLVSAEALAGFFKLFTDHVHCVVLNACYSEVQAEAIAEHISYVVGMNDTIEDKAALEFAIAFYDALGAGKTFDFAYELACNAILMAGIEEHQVPVLLAKEAEEGLTQQVRKNIRTFKARPPELSRAFDSLITERTRNFVGREFVSAELDAFLSGGDYESGYFIIKGEPGIGKSALMAHLVKERGYIHHFNIALQAINKPRQFLKSVCAQLIARFELEHETWPPNAEKDGMFLNQLLGEASEKLKSGERLVIVIDALDEADLMELSSRTNALYLPPNLPPNVFFVVTTRPKHDIHLEVLNPCGLEVKANSENNLQDARRYITFFLPDERMQQRISDWNVTLEEFTDTILEKSEGNFMYLHHVLPAIKAGRFVEGRLDELPEGLLGYYRSHWRQMKSQDEETFEKFYQPVVCVLAAVKEAVSVTQVEAYTEISPNKIRDVIREWREFLYEELNKDRERLYRVYHTSFQEFLQYEVDPGLKTYHRMIAGYYLRLAGKGNI